MPQGVWGLSWIIPPTLAVGGIMLGEHVYQSDRQKTKTQQQSEVQGQTEGNSSFLAHRESFVDETVEEFLRVKSRFSWHSLNFRSNWHKVVQMQNMKTARWTTQSKSTVWCRLKNQAVETKDKAEWSKKEWEKYTSFRRFWNMLLFDSVWKREGEESVGRETGSQTDRGSVSWQRPNESCSWKWKC